MTTLVTTHVKPEFRVEPHRWQTSMPSRITRRLGRRWVIARHVEEFCRPLTVDGLENFDFVHGPAIIIANHSSHFDTPVVLSVLPERIRSRTAVGAAADRFYRRGKRTWWYSLFFNTFPIVRGGGSATLDYARDLLQRGWSVVIYPEGTRSTSDVVHQFRHGVAILATQMNIPVVPIYTEGLRNVMPRGERTPRPAAVVVRIGAPVWLDDLTSIPDATERLRASLLTLGVSAQPTVGAAAEPLWRTLFAVAPSSHEGTLRLLFLPPSPDPAPIRSDIKRTQSTAQIRNEAFWFMGSAGPTQSSSKSPVEGKV